MAAPIVGAKGAPVGLGGLRSPVEFRYGTGMGKHRLATLFAVLGVLLLAGRVVAEPWPAPSVDGLSDDAWGHAVRLGRDLIVATPKLIGPEAADPARRFSGNDLSCQNCHLSAGTGKFALPFVGVFADFPQYRAREGRVGTLEDRINGCMTRSLNGRELPFDGPEMRAIVAYMKFLSTGIAVGAVTPGRGAAEVPLLDRAADPTHGAAVYMRTCAACHGVNGAGQRNGSGGDAEGYAFPPLWGPDSFNDGAGMARLITIASFVHGNMPAGTTWQNPTLTTDEAWDVGAFVESKPRPHMEGLDHDYPNLLQKPVDAAYGPYADQFAEEQHRFGPFQPIKDAVRHLQMLATSAPADASKPTDSIRN
jgi:thiosulfate dehydrogenase